MRLIAFPICIFLNVMLFGMCGYIYLLWLQYWHRIWAQTKHEEPGYEMSDFRKNEMIVDYYDEASIPPTADPLKTEKDKHSPLVYLHKDMYPGKFTDVRLQMFKTKTVALLRSALFAESGNMNPQLENPYGVRWTDQNYNNTDLVCDLYSTVKKVKTLQKSVKLIREDLRQVLPNEDFFSNTSEFNTCAVISSAGSLYRSNLGEFIDSHNIVLRFNNAPVIGYEKDVGAKTTIRILNSQILANSQFDFLNSDLYKDVSLLVWDPSNYTSTLAQWLEAPEHNFLQPYINFRQKYPRSNFHILDPSVLWLIWDFIQGHTTIKIKRNPPSSGFLGIVFLLSHCSKVNVFEYVPTKRVTQRCHYYSQKLDPLCTYGVWHPLAAEKLLALDMNTASDENVFYNGYISIPGYSSLTKCSINKQNRPTITPREPK